MGKPTNRPTKLRVEVPPEPPPPKKRGRKITPDAQLVIETEVQRSPKTTMRIAAQVVFPELNPDAAYNWYRGFANYHKKEIQARRGGPPKLSV